MNRDIAISERDGSWAVGPHVPDQPAGKDPGALDLSRLLKILYDWRWLIVGAVVAGIALGIVYTLLTTPQYRAAVTIEVNPPTVEIIDDKQQNPFAGLNSWEFVQTQVGLLQSRALAQRVAQDLNLANNPAFADLNADPATRLRQATGKVASNIKVIPPEAGQLIRFEYVAESPQVAADVANAYADAFINSSLQRRYEASTYARNFLQRQIAKTRNDLERSERQLVSYAQSQGIIDTSSSEEGRGGDSSSLQGQSLVSLNEALAQATARRVAAEGAYRQAQSVGATDVASSTQELRQARAALEADYQEKRTSLKPEHPEMLSLRSRIDALDQQIARERSTVAGSRANTLRGEYQAALSAERALQGRVAALKGQVLNLRGRSIQYTILQRDVDTNRALYDALLQRYKEIGVAGGIGSAPVSIVDRADVPGGPFKPDLIFALAVGAVLGLVAGVLAAVGLEFLNDTIRTRADVREKLGLACLGAIPKRASKRGELVRDLDDPASEISEAYSTLATSLRFTTEQGMPKTLMLASARAAEGKSSTALALAVLFARRGDRVLLVDADLRKPVFRADSENQGLSQLLTSDDRLAAHVVPTTFENLSLLPCGPVPPNPSDLLSTSRFRSIIREAEAQFDMVLVDAPPVLGLADAPLLASVAGDVLLIIESGKTRTSAALEAINRLRSAGATVLGVNLTKSTEEKRGYGYAYGYGYGYNYRAVDRKKSDLVLLTRQSDA